MTYLILNLHRSGSSMMMRCLEAGGLEPSYDRLSDTMNHSAPADYIPNPNGFYQYAAEITPAFYKQNEGKLVKYLSARLKDLPLGEYKAIVLKRNPEEIRKSMASWTPFNSWGSQESATYFYEEYMTVLKSALKERSDIEFIEVDYKDIIDNPQKAFEFIQSNNWPIDPSLCAEKVDSGLYRNRLEKDKQ